MWKALTAKLGELLKVDSAERAEDDTLVIERILILVRNVLQVPRDSGSERRTDDDVSLHDQVLWVLHKSGMEDLLLYMSSSDDETMYCLHVLEIVSLMFKEQGWRSDVASVAVIIEADHWRGGRGEVKMSSLVTHIASKVNQIATQLLSLKKITNSVPPRCTLPSRSGTPSPPR